MTKQIYKPVETILIQTFTPSFKYHTFWCSQHDLSGIFISPHLCLVFRAPFPTFPTALAMLLAAEVLRSILDHSKPLLTWPDSNSSDWFLPQADGVGGASYSLWIDAQERKWGWGEGGKSMRQWCRPLQACTVLVTGLTFALPPFRNNLSLTPISVNSTRKAKANLVSRRALHWRKRLNACIVVLLSH